MNRPSMTPAQWRSRRSAKALMRYAAPLLSRRHLALVLADIASGVWEQWRARNPDDWFFAWTIALLRAWAFGETTTEELRQPLTVEVGSASRVAIADEAGRSYAEYERHELAQNLTAASAVAVMRAVEAVTTSNVEESAVGVIEAVALVDGRAAELAAHREFRCVESGLRDLWESDEGAGERVLSAEDAREERRLTREHDRAVERARVAPRRALALSLAASADTIRALVPYVTRPASDWTVTGELAISGEVLLRLDGWLVVDAVRSDELLGLDGHRSVAFDAAQERFGSVLSAGAAG